MSNKMMLWRGMTSQDIGQVLQVADAIHPDLPESRDVFAERASLFPEGCLVLADEQGHVGGYVISHPIKKGGLPELDSAIRSIPPEANQYYIHDLAIVPGLRGKGYAEKCMQAILKAAGRYPSSCLVSVYGTSKFWGRFGFVPGAVDAQLSEKLRGYGEGAQYLIRHAESLRDGR